MPSDSNAPTTSSYHPLLPSPLYPTSRTPAFRSNQQGTRSKSRFTDEPTQRSRGQPEFRSRPGDDLESQRGTDDPTEDYYHQQELMIMKQQDQTLGTISGVVDVLREQASLMGQEISEQNVMLDELDDQIDYTESKLSKANRKLNEFIKENKNSKSSWAIVFLIIILTILLLAIILT
ncbi:hypothetical protein PCANC_06143 [Puccinia coronata f. sp. avenae]|uniref:t-SNARE affecting a late Golgi compartment protein 1 n=1 Tax=Puccinia coronata f. sp. avenae TaxID=200324 RepID=A0A2N5VTL6_9BASI|nr:hypothetical protein PCASD_23064 [Puccinia coronata f. sp. avenae]PLW46052.1 hypothetical protein PCASD_03463 [Puccinia coronata f. sp. avenae]PLW53325.1 hypothetical protein PCANC_06143 [Puccinia coronata f. sp. avenae]